MPRLVRLTHTGPAKMEPSEKPIWVCACGLSRTFPICDGTHKTARVAETDPAALYIYDADRRAIVETRPDEPPPPAISDSTGAIGGSPASADRRET